MRGELVVFEGLNDVGKTASSQRLASLLTASGVDAEWHSFPGSVTGTLGLHVRRLHQDPTQYGISAVSADSLQMLHVAAHTDTITSRILPAIRRGAVVVLDRFWWSTWAYGVCGGARRDSLRALVRIERHYWSGVRPILVAVLERPGATSMQHRSCLERCYNGLLRRESRRHAVTRIVNDATVDVAAERIRMAWLQARDQLRGTK